MSRLLLLYRSSVGKKIIMAVTGLILLLFVFVHMLGNMKIYFGQEAYTHYAEWLRVMGAPMLARGQGLWIARMVLLGALALHLLCAAQLTLQSWGAREVPYKFRKDIAFSVASTTMRWGGLTLLAFVVFHLLDLTLGTIHPGYQENAVFHNVVTGFGHPLISAVYVVAMIPLGLHIYHGLWSTFQTLGIDNPRYNGWRRPLAGVVALAIIIGNISIPVAILAGWVHETGGAH
jgi:succinate dehydrogenase / fumarate reductase, cytochrome b subunit